MTPFISRMRIESKHGNTRIWNAKILLKRMGNDLELLRNAIRCDMSGNVFDRHMVGHQGNPKVWMHQKHQGISVERLRQIIGMPRKAKILALDGCLVDGSCDEGIDVSLL
jgi:hypothetical protein